MKPHQKFDKNNEVIRKLSIYILIAIVSATTSGIFKSRSAIYGNFIDRLNYLLNNTFSYYWHRKKTFGIKVMAVSRTGDSTSPQTNNASQTKKVTLDNSNTAIIIVDPWNLKKQITPNRIQVEEINQNKLFPLVENFLKRDFLIYVATNKCTKNLNISCGVHKDFPKSKKIEFVYHQYETTQSFENKLRKRGIENLIYFGFSSNQCLLGSRKVSMIPMYHKGFKIYFIPEASHAMETINTFSKGLVHEITTITISQWAADILDYSEVIEKLKKRSKLIKS